MPRNLRVLAGMHDLTTTELAGLLGISRAGLSNLMNGHSDPSYSTLAAIRHLFGPDAADLDRPTGAFVVAVANEAEFNRTEKLIAMARAGRHDMAPKPRRRSRTR